jgi:hypothetical protein
MGLSLALAYVPAYTDRIGLWTLDGEAVRWDGVVLGAIGGTLRILPLFVLGQRFSGLVAIQKQHRLVTTGIYAMIRHPSYLGLLMTVAGWALVFRSGVGSQRAGASDLDHRILALGEFHDFRKIGPGLRRRWRCARLLDAHMVHDEPRVGVAVDQRRARLDVAPEQDVDREIVFDGRAQDAVEPRIVRRAL